MLLRERLLQLLYPSRRERFFALKDICFQLEHGESVAVIGHNGAGKSTLLSLAAGLATPQSGRVRVEGRIAALLELGSGFHPDLTGAENVRINAGLLGLSRRQTQARFQEIMEFSGIGDFFYEPLRTYSSGMMLRLAFSVAVCVEPDVLVIDEVLGVGDEAFFAKCVSKIMEFRNAGKTILCASHSTGIVKMLCNRALWLDHGALVLDGPINAVVESYQDSVLSGKVPAPRRIPMRPPPPAAARTERAAQLK